MLQGFLHYWCLLLLCCTMLSAASYLPFTTSHRVPDLHQIVERSLANKAQQASHTSHVVKRSSYDTRYRSFYRKLAQHSRYRDEQAFVEKMFRTFDMNYDQVIERDEFRAILQLLGIISHAY